MSQRVAVRARVGARERQGEIQQEPERASESLRAYVRARGSQSGRHSYPFGRLVTKEASLTFLAYQNIVLLQNN